MMYPTDWRVCPVLYSLPYSTRLGTVYVSYSTMLYVYIGGTPTALGPSLLLKYSAGYCLCLVWSRLLTWRTFPRVGNIWCPAGSGCAWSWSSDLADHATGNIFSCWFRSVLWPGRPRGRHYFFSLVLDVLGPDLADHHAAGNICWSASASRSSHLHTFFSYLPSRTVHGWFRVCGPSVENPILEKVRSGGSGQTFALPTKKKVSEQMQVASAPTYASILKKGLKWAPVTVHSFWLIPS